MAKEFKIVDVLDVLRRAGIEIDDDAAATAGKQFDGMVIVKPERLLGDGQIAVNEDSFDKLRADMKIYKSDARKLKTQLDDANDMIESGGAKMRKQLETTKTELDRIRPIADRFVTTMKSRWDEWREKIPDNLKRYYVFPDGENELTDDDVLANVAKLTEHMEIGALDTGNEPPHGGMPRKSPTNTKPTGRDAWDGKSPHEKMGVGYDNVRLNEGEKQLRPDETQ